MNTSGCTKVRIESSVTGNKAPRKLESRDLPSEAEAWGGRVLKLSVADADQPPLTPWLRLVRFSLIKMPNT